MEPLYYWMYFQWLHSLSSNHNVPSVSGTVQTVDAVAEETEPFLSKFAPLQPAVIICLVVFVAVVLIGYIFAFISHDHGYTRGDNDDDHRSNIKYR